MKTLFTECSQRNFFSAIETALPTARSAEIRIHAVECQDIVERHGDLIKEQYAAVARQWLASFPRIA